ncbi:MAG: hypothetical protein IJB83_03365 [Bacilli bacterium]|nr:hypothetical protein [Bacilli bacterium]
MKSKLECILSEIYKKEINEINATTQKNKHNSGFAFHTEKIDPSYVSATEQRINNELDEIYKQEAKTMNDKCRVVKKMTMLKKQH